MSLIAVGDAANKLVITEMADKLNAILGDRIKDAEIHLKTDDQLRKRAGGMRLYHLVDGEGSRAARHGSS